MYVDHNIRRGIVPSFLSSRKETRGPGPSTSMPRAAHGSFVGEEDIVSGDMLQPADRAEDILFASSSSNHSVSTEEQAELLDEDLQRWWVGWLEREPPATFDQTHASLWAAPPVDTPAESRSEEKTRIDISDDPPSWPLGSPSTFSLPKRTSGVPRAPPPSIEAEQDVDVLKWPPDSPVVMINEQYQQDHSAYGTTPNVTSNTNAPRSTVTLSLLPSSAALPPTAANSYPPSTSSGTVHPYFVSSDNYERRDKNWQRAGGEAGGSLGGESRWSGSKRRDDGSWGDISHADVDPSSLDHLGWSASATSSVDPSLDHLGWSASASSCGTKNEALLFPLAGPGYKTDTGVSDWPSISRAPSSSSSTGVLGLASSALSSGHSSSAVSAKYCPPQRRGGPVLAFSSTDGPKNLNGWEGSGLGGKQLYGTKGGSNKKSSVEGVGGKAKANQKGNWSSAWRTEGRDRAKAPAGKHLNKGVWTDPSVVSKAGFTHTRDGRKGVSNKGGAIETTDLHRAERSRSGASVGENYPRSVDAPFGVPVATPWTTTSQQPQQGRVMADHHSGGLGPSSHDHPRARDVVTVIGRDQDLRDLRELRTKLQTGRSDLRDDFYARVLERCRNLSSHFLKLSPYFRPAATHADVQKLLTASTSVVVPAQPADFRELNDKLLLAREFLNILHDILFCLKGVFTNRVQKGRTSHRASSASTPRSGGGDGDTPGQLRRKKRPGKMSVKNVSAPPGLETQLDEVSQLVVSSDFPTTAFAENSSPHALSWLSCLQLFCTFGARYLQATALGKNEHLLQMVQCYVILGQHVVDHVDRPDEGHEEQLSQQVIKVMFGKRGNGLVFLFPLVDLVRRAEVLV